MARELLAPVRRMVPGIAVEGCMMMMTMEGYGEIACLK